MTAEQKRILRLQAQVQAQEQYIQQQHQQNEELRASDTMQQHRNKLLGKRAAPSHFPSEEQVTSAVATMIKKRRRTRATEARPATLQQKRATEKRIIAAVIREHKAELVEFKDIMRVALEAARECSFSRLKCRNDFTDGFLLHDGRLTGGRAMQRLLLDQGLEVGQPIQSRKEGCHWFQLAGPPYSIKSSLRILKEVVEMQRPSTSPGQAYEAQPLLVQYDATRDVRGTFYCLENWREKHEELRLQLNGISGGRFKDNGNSFASCL